MRRASRSMGRAVLRAASASWPGGWVERLRAAVPEGPLVPVATGGAARAAGVTGEDAALVVAYGSITAPATAAVRLLGLDPLAVAAVLARMAADVDGVAATAVGFSSDWSALPTASAPLIEVGAEHHAAREVRLFAS
jgi:urease accessory protein